MTERLSLARKIALGSALAAGSLGVSACAGDSVTDKFTYAVDCGDKSVDILSTDVDYQGGADVTFDCEGVAPESVNLISGEDTVTVEPSNGDEIITITAQNRNGDLGFSTDMKSETRISDIDATISISGVSEIHGVVVGDQVAPE